MFTKRQPYLKNFIFKKKVTRNTKIKNKINNNNQKVPSISTYLGIDQVIKSDPIEISELKYRKRTEKTIDDLKETIQFMENQLMEAKATYEHEEIVLKECHQLHETLNEAIIQQRNMAGVSNELV